ncbi:Protein FAM160A1 [Portunus trituberculatus]|uniref:Protein FAM160A1 n=1 Tax=Portunus trituberculatus TaxID=210409 RepID=A0A5B7K0U4_PORTR|nr:Protein FAM160A1 [Portunus trituberculatus]
MLTSSIHINLLVATLLSRLAAFPTPLLTSLLLDTSIVFQPAVRSLVQGRCSTEVFENMSLGDQGGVWCAVQCCLTTTPVTILAPSTTK